MSDRNALLTTCASSGATIVAIVGGLLVARYVALSSEQDGASRRLLALEDRAVVAQDQEERAGQLLADLVVTRALVDSSVIDVVVERHTRPYRSGRHPDKVPDPRPEPVVRDDLKDLLPEDLSADQEALLRSRLSKVNDEVREAAHEVALWAQGPSNSSARWDDVRGGLYRPGWTESLWERAWNMTSKAIRKARLRNSPYGSIAALALDIPDVPFLGPVISVRDERLRLERERDDARTQLAVLRTEIAIAQRDADLVGRPRGLISGLLVLGYLTLVSVIWPLLLLTPGPDAMAVDGSLWAVAAFISGIVVLFAYLGHHAWRLRPRPTTPFTS